MATSPKHRLKQHDKVLMAARKCFIRHGFHSTGMAEIAKACRMSVGNIYHYFPEKNAIMQAITDSIRASLLPKLQPLANHGNPVEDLIAVMLLSFRDIRSDSNARLWMEISAEAPRNKFIRDIWLLFDRDLRDLLEHLMQRAVKVGQLPADTDLKASSLWLVALLDGAIARLSVQPDLDLASTQNTLAQNLRRCLRIDRT